MRPGKILQEGNGVIERRFSIFLFHRPFELKWCNIFFLALKSRAVCDGLIAFNRGEAGAKTECSCQRSQENRNVSSPKSKLLLIPIKFFPKKTVC